MNEGLPNVEWCNLRKSHIDGMLYTLNSEKDEILDKIAKLTSEQNIINRILDLHRGEIKDDD